MSARAGRPVTKATCGNAAASKVGRRPERSRRRPLRGGIEGGTEQLEGLWVDPVIRPTTALLPAEHAGVGEHPKMVRDGRLRQPERDGQVAHARLAAGGDDADQSETGGVGDHAEGAGEPTRLLVPER